MAINNNIPNLFQPRVPGFNNTSSLFNIDQAQVQQAINQKKIDDGLVEQEQRKRLDEQRKLQNLADTFRMINANKSGNVGAGNVIADRIAQRKLLAEQKQKEALLKTQQDEFVKNNPQYKDMIEANRLFNIDIQRKGKTSTADIDNFEYYMSLSKEGKKAWRENKRLSPELMGLISQSQSAGRDGGVSLTPIEKKIDENFAKEAVEYSSGGKAQIEANIINLDDKIKILEKGELNVSGPFIGNIPEGAQSILNPPALSFIGDIRDIVFQSLREKLGAQFTEREGDRLVAAAFDQRLPEAANIKRLKRLQGVIKNAAKSKEDMIAYANQNNTLKGYEADPLTFNSIYDSLVSEDFAGKTDEELKSLFKNGNEDTKNAIIRFLEKREK